MFVSTAVMTVSPCLKATSSVLGPACTTDTLANYEQLDSGCNIGPLQFLSFAFGDPVVTGQAPAATASDIKVTPTLLASGPTIAFSSSFFSFSGSGSALYHINYAVDPGPIIGGESISLDPPQGDVSITQGYCQGTLTCAPGGVPPLNLTVTPANRNASLTFPTPQSMVGIQTSISITSTAVIPAGFDSFINTNVTTTTTPEPGVRLLIPAGVALLLLFCGKRGDLCRTLHGRV
jgi:hypothetical protein